MDLPDRHEKRRQRTRTKLLDAALQVFGEKGFHEASVQDITDLADLGKRTFYLHFADKEALLRELAMTKIDDIRMKVSTVFNVTDEEAMRVKLHHAVEAIFSWAQANPRVTLMMFGAEGHPELMLELYGYISQIFVDELSCGIELREDSCLTLEAIGRALTGMIIQLGFWSLGTDQPQTPESLAKMVTTLLYDRLGEQYNMKEIETEAISTEE